MTDTTPRWMSIALLITFGLSVALVTGLVFTLMGPPAQTMPSFWHGAGDALSTLRLMATCRG